MSCVLNLDRASIFILPLLSFSLQHAEEKARDLEKVSEKMTTSPSRAQRSKADKKRASDTKEEEFKPTPGSVLNDIR